MGENERESERERESLIKETLLLTRPTGVRSRAGVRTPHGLPQHADGGQGVSHLLSAESPRLLLLSPVFIGSLLLRFVSLSLTPSLLSILVGSIDIQSRQLCSSPALCSSRILLLPSVVPAPPLLQPRFFSSHK